MLEDVAVIIGIELVDSTVLMVALAELAALTTWSVTNTVLITIVELFKLLLRLLGYNTIGGRKRERTSSKKGEYNPISS